ncbi:MAG TPA: double zinc ribbon domain-containing protein, partial [Gemmatimonadaceae bacterium]|nr:double zinc ribbon domain-containing protein [Gemmatimonadaceae bacterium]
MIRPPTLAELRSAGRLLLDLALPPACVACGALIARRGGAPATDDGPVCGGCWARLRRLPHPQCERCGHPVEERACRWCEQLPPWVRCVRSVSWVDSGSAAGIIYALKYDGWEGVAAGMAARM